MTNSVIQKFVLFVFFGIVASGCALESDPSVTAKKDIEKPTLTEVTAVSSPTSNTEPSYTFNTTQAGTISFGGSCTSTTLSAVSGDNTITFSSLSDGTYSDCTITVTDSSGNTSSSLSVSSFVIDSTAPTVSSTSPTDNQSGVSISDNISVTFSESMDNTTVTTNTDNTTCYGSFQLSLDNFSSCIQMSSSPLSSNSNKTFTVTPSSSLSSNTTYKIRVTNGVKDSASNELSIQWTTSTSFTTINWVGTKQIGTSSEESANGVSTDSSGNIYVSGSTAGGLDGNTNLGGNDIFLVKYNSSGTKQWTKQLGTSSNDYASGVVTDSSGNVYLPGYTGGGLHGNTLGGSWDLIVVKYDSSGTNQWTQQLGNGQAELTYGAAVDSSDNIYLTGFTGGTLDCISNCSTNNHTDMILVKYNSSGVKQWTNQLGTSVEDRGVGVSVDSSNNIYLTGYTLGGLDNNTNSGGRDIFLVKYNSSGTKQWTRQLGTTSGDLGNGVTVDSSNNIYVTGSTGGSLDNNTNAGSYDLFVVKYDSSGTKQWTRQLGTTSGDSGQGVTVDSSNNIYLTGYTLGGLDNNTNSGGRDIFLVKYNSSGTKQWTRQLGSSSNDSGQGVTVDSSNNIYLTGYTEGGLDNNTNAGGNDLFLVKYNSDGVLQ